MTQLEDRYQARFYQEGITIGNQWQEDLLLQKVIRRLLPDEVMGDVEEELDRLGERVVTDIYAFGEDAEANQPTHVPFGPWGKRIDHIETSHGWKALDRAAAEEGIVADAYARRHGEHSRIYQMAKLYLYNPSSAVYSCPLAMTDGAARLIEVYGDDELKQRAYTRLTSRDPKTFWTSGQWMTERTGGSDLGGSETIARRNGDGWQLYGTKFFTSAVTANAAMTLARIVDDKGDTVPGSRGLSLFYLEPWNDDGTPNLIEIHRLKDKLGTQALPTAELSLHGTPAVLLGGEGHGIRKISTLFNITRIYNSVCAVSGMRRSIAMARDFATKREAFGSRIADLPLHTQTLADLELELAAGVQIIFDLARILGREECGTATDDEKAVLRMLTPLAKLYTAKQGIAVASECIESVGGTGYMEDSGMPRLLRGAQTLSIWEGTTNVLSLDMLRAMEKEGALPPFMDTLKRRLNGVEDPDLQEARQRLKDALQQVEDYLPEAMRQGADYMQAGARQMAFTLTRIHAGALLLEQAVWERANGDGERAAEIARRWCAAPLATLIHPGETVRGHNRVLGLGLQA